MFQGLLEMLVTLNLTGEMAELHAPKVQVHANTLREALGALKLIDCFNPSKNPKRYLCSVEGVETYQKLDEPLESNDFTINCNAVVSSRDVMGSGNNPWVRIIVGVVLIIVGVFYDYSGITAETGAGMVAAGIGMVVGGIMELLNPVKLDQDDNEKNQSFTSYPNTVKSGTPIPLILGKHKWGGHIFSMNAETSNKKSVDILDIVGTIPEFNGSWVTFMSSMIGTYHQGQRPPGGGGGGGGGRTDIPRVNQQ